MIKEILEKEEKKVEYLELIYDLIFVYVIGRNNSLLHHISGGFVESGMFLAYVLCTLAVIQIWNFTTYYINLYGRNGARDHVFLFINMFLLYFVAEGTREHWQEYQMQYHLAWALILINIGVQYLIELRNHKGDPEQQKRIRNVMIILFAESAIILASIPLYSKTGVWFLSLAAILFGILATLLFGNGKKTVVVDFSHLSERAMLYVVFTFGEMIIAIASYFEGSLSVRGLYFSAMAFIIVIGLFLSYGTLYDHIIDREIETNGLIYMLFHIFIIFSLNNITTALEFMRNEDIDLLPKITLLVASLVIYYMFLFALCHYAKKKCGFKKKFFLLMLLLGASFAVVMFIFRNNMFINIAVTVAYVFGIYIMLYRISKKIRTQIPTA